MCLQFVRTTSAYTRWMPAIVQFALWAEWTSLSVASSTESPYFRALQELDRAMRASRMETNVLIHFAPGKFPDAELERIEAVGRVVLVLAKSADLVAIAVAARRAGLTTEGWAWMGLDEVHGADRRAELAAQEDARLALDGWIYFEPHSNVPQDFSDRVRDATKSKFPYEGNFSQTIFAANMFDSILLFASAVGAHPSELYNGSLLARAMINTSVRGVTGLVRLDENGDMLEWLQAVNYLHTKYGEMERSVVGVFDGTTLLYSPIPGTVITWPGRSHIVPLDVRPSSDFTTTWLLVGSGTAAVIVVVGILICFRKNYKDLQHLMFMLFSEVVEITGSICLCVNSFASFASSHHHHNGARAFAGTWPNW